MSDAHARSIDARMSDAIEAMDRDFNHIRTGRASTSLVERLQVDYYGTPTPLNQLAGISVPEATTVVIQPWDRNALQPIERAIMKSRHRHHAERGRHGRAPEHPAAHRGAPT